MTHLNLLSIGELPEGFVYPRAFLHILELGINNLEPWYMLDGDGIRQAMDGLEKRYSGSKLIPFARRQDNDDIACWQAASNEEVFIIHDFASAGWERRDQFNSFYDWLRRAIEDLIEFDC